MRIVIKRIPSLQCVEVAVVADWAVVDLGLHNKGKALDLTRLLEEAVDELSDFLESINE